MTLTRPRPRPVRTAAVALACAVLVGSGVLAVTAGATGPWRSARSLPGAATLFAKGYAELNAISCTAAGDCSVDGYYTDGSGHRQAFLDDEVNGAWRTASEVPGTAALNVGGEAQAQSLSCAAPGDCAVVGYYTDGSGHKQAFVADSEHGVWHPAIQIPGTATLNVGGDAEGDQVSCPGADTCTAVGTYSYASGRSDAFTVQEAHGAWAPAVAMPGIDALNAGGEAYLYALACPGVGACTAVGTSKDGAGATQAFAAGEVAGTWLAAQELPGSAALNGGGDAEPYTLSCSSSGNCAAGGEYKDSVGHYQAFVASETGGTWGAAAALPGVSALNTGGGAGVDSISCSSPGNCSLGGQLQTTTAYRGFVDRQVGGAWRTATFAPGLNALDTHGTGSVNAVSCSSEGNCSAGGFYADKVGFEAFVIDEVHGVWQRAIEVPGSGALNPFGDGRLDVMSCLRSGYCA
ncbi:MAG TPA: hypothetical protein VGS61_00975, partial [Acidimicrobiales bacterium]|nr:hypothetical protein [Acidimicrobiales bacterium]